MKNIIYQITALGFLFLTLAACSKDSGLPEKQPSEFDGNWVVFEIRENEIFDQIEGPFDLVTSVDPNRDSTVLIDNLYASGLRIRSPYDTTAFEVVMAEQLEKNNAGFKNIAFISARGYVSDNSPLRSFIYSLAASYYENIAFTETDIEDIIFMRVGYYEENKALFDTVMILGYRKTGFEEENW